MTKEEAKEIAEDMQDIADAESRINDEDVDWGLAKQILSQEGAKEKYLKG